MPVPTAITDLSTTAASNSPAGSDNVFPSLDDYIRAHASFIAQLNAALEAMTGMIVLWSGSSASIPSGWALCDGTNGTPDLRNRFIVGAGSSYAVGATGGATSASTDYQGNHYHPSVAISVGGTALTESQIPSHRHSINIGSNRVIKWATPAYGSGGYEPQYEGGLGGNYTAGWSDYTGSGSAHSHSASGYTDYQGSHAHTVATVPPYYALCYIMKV